MPIQTKTAEEIVVDLLNNIVGEKLGDVTAGSILRIIVEALAKSEEDIYDQIQKLYDAIYIYKAEGEDLDRLAALLGLERKKGFKARGYVTFYHGQLDEDKTIPSGTKVATPDNRVFTSTLTTQVKHFISHEQHLFRSVIKRYKLNERFGNVAEVLGVVGGVEQNVSFKAKDVKDEWIFSPDDLIVVAPTDTTTNWTTTTGSLSSDGEKLTLTFSSANNVKLTYTHASPIQINHYKQFSSFINIQNIDNLRKVYIRVKSSDLDYWEWSLDKFSLQNNNYNVLEFPNAKIVGIPNPNSITKVEFEFDFYVNVDNTIEVKQIFNTSAEKYTGTIVEISGLDDNTNFKVSYFPYSKEVWVESEEVGTNYNVSAGEINKLLTAVGFVKWVKNFEDIQNAEDVESDDKFRERILNQQYISGRATKAAIESAINQLDFIQTAYVDDLFTTSVTNEEHTYNTGQDEYVLFNTGIVDINQPITVTDEDGNSYDYEDDFIIVYPNKLKWVGDTPSDGKKFYVTYKYKQLGFFKLFVVPKRSLSADDYNKLDQKIQEVKAAGIQYVVEEPTYIYVDVSVDVKLTDNSLQNEVRNAIYYTVRDWLNSRNIGESVYRSQLIDIIMDAHEAIKYIQLTQPTTDVTINSNEVAKAGNININFI